MNTNIKLLFATGILTLAVGCTDLDVPVSSQYTKYPSSEIAVQAKMANIYFKMKDFKKVNWPNSLKLLKSQSQWQNSLGFRLESKAGAVF